MHRKSVDGARVSPIRRLAVLLAGGGLMTTGLVGVGLVVGAGPAAAASQIFAYSGAAQVYTVPAGVSILRLEVIGGGGGSGSGSIVCNLAAGGAGARVISYQ
ncbi:MAG: hypothetical protein WCP28_17570, partial [Actinomycetes bacterium]